MIPADVQQNIFYTLYFIVLHNFWAIIYATGIVLSLLYALYKPTRASIILVLGFSILLFNFEYNKHIAEGLKTQTENSLVTMRPSAKIPRILHITLIKLPPLILPVIGWGLLGLAAYGLKTKKRWLMH